MRVAQKSMAGQKVKAYVQLAEKSETFWNGVIVFLGVLFLLGAVPFYPVYLVPLLALFCGLIAARHPPIAVLLGVILAFPAVAYQSPVFGLFFLIVLVIVLIEMMSQWEVIAILEILILAPFSFGHLPYFGWITVLGMALAAMHFGSKKSIFISIPSVLVILILSSLWLVYNGAYLPVNLDLYQPADPDLLFSKSPVAVQSIAQEAFRSIGAFMQFSNLSKVSNAIPYLLRNIFTILIRDSGLIQLISWAVALFSISFLSGRLKGSFSQLLSSLSLFIVPAVYYASSILFNTSFDPDLLVAIIASVCFLGISEQLGLHASREIEVGRKEKMKAYGKFGMSDIGLSGEERSMDDVGGYNDVKQELRDAIIMPLEKKEIAYTYGIKPPAGILLFGPPGTGKTMLMRALAKELKYNFIEVRCSQILSQWYGESLPANEKLFVMDGQENITRMEIGDIVEEKRKVTVLCFDQYGRTVFADIKDWIKHRCSSPIYEVKTRTGRKIKVTGYHSLFTLNGTKMESIEVSNLSKKKSYIAIPRKIAFSSKPKDKIYFVDFLRKEDHGLLVKNAGKYVKEAIARIGRKKVAQLLHYDRVSYLNTLVKDRVGIRVSYFLDMIDNASITFNKEDLLIGAGSKRLPGVIGIDENFATFIGLWIAEGSYNREDTVRISVSSDEIDRISGLCRELFGNITVYEKKNGKGRDIYIGSRPLYVLLRHVLDLGHGAKNKKMPDFAFSLDKRNMAALLRGYFSGDGSIYENQRGVAIVEGCTVSTELSDQLLYLLLYFGIVASVYDKPEWNGTVSRRVCMFGGRELSKFREIGFLDPGKMVRLERSIRRVGWFRDQQIPITGLLRTTIEQSLPKWSDSATIGLGALRSYDLGDVNSSGFMDNDIYLDRVEEIQRVDDEEFVYDVSVNPCQNFVAGLGGVFAHNSEKNLVEVFGNARKSAPTILFFDEIDSLGKKRGRDTIDEVGPRVLSTLLQEMDGANKTKSSVIVVGATNVPHELDPALLRPGRFDKIIYMHLPDFQARKSIFDVTTKELPIDEDVNLDILAKKTDRFSGADIKNISVEARGIAAKEASKQGKIVPINMSHFLQVLKNIKPSTSLAQLDEYERFRMDFERRVTKEEAKPKEDAISWEDVAGLDAIKNTLLETIQLPLLHEDMMKEFKVKPSKGMLLFGPPGTGKTLIVRAASNELKVSFQSLSGAEMMRQGYTQAVSVIRETFNRARENAPAILFVDEIETFAPSRSVRSSELVGQFLTEMDGLTELKGVVVIGATNRPDMLDPAILRPGRFDKIFYIPPPDLKGRAAIFGIHLGKKFSGSVDLMKAAEATSGFTGADIASICQEAKMQALRAKLGGKDASISDDVLIQIIKKRRPSVTPRMLKEYETFLEEYGERR